MNKYDNSYSPYFKAASEEYPEGSAINATDENSVDGTPILAKFFNDVIGFMYAVFHGVYGNPKVSGETVTRQLSGVTENAKSSDVWDAIKKFVTDTANGVLRQLTAFINTKGKAGGIAPLGDDAKVSKIHLPSIDDVLSLRLLRYKDDYMAGSLDEENNILTVVLYSKNGTQKTCRIATIADSQGSLSFGVDADIESYRLTTTSCANGEKVEEGTVASSPRLSVSWSGQTVSKVHFNGLVLTVKERNTTVLQTDSYSGDVTTSGAFVSLITALTGKSESFGNVSFEVCYNSAVVSFTNGSTKTLPTWTGAVSVEYDLEYNNPNAKDNGTFDENVGGTIQGAFL